MEKLSPWFVYPFILMCAKVVALCLQQVGRQSVVTEPVEIAQRRSERRNRNPVFDSCSTDSSPTLLNRFDALFKEGVEQQIFQSGILVECFLDITQKYRTDNASATPHQRNSSIVEIPFVLLGSLHHQVISLSVRNDLRSVESLFQVTDELLLISLECRLLACDYSRSLYPKLFLGRKTAREDRFADKCKRNTQVECRYGRPFSGTFLSRCIENLFNQGASILVFICQNICRNLDQIGVEPSRFPLFKHLVLFKGIHS